MEVASLISLVLIAIGLCYSVYEVIVTHKAAVKSQEHTLAEGANQGDAEETIDSEDIPEFKPTDKQMAVLKMYYAKRQEMFEKEKELAESLDVSFRTLHKALERLSFTERERIFKQLEQLSSEEEKVKYLSRLINKSH